MKRVTVLALVLLASGFCTAAQAENKSADEPALVWASRYVLLTATTDEKLLPAIMGFIQRPQPSDSTSLDLLAEMLWTIRAKKLPIKKTGLRILSILVNSPSAGRYDDTIETLNRYLNDNRTNLSLERYRRDHKHADAEQYIAGTIDLEALRRQLVQSAIDTQPTMSQAQALADLPSNATMDEMFAVVGKPTLVVGREIRVDNAISVRVVQLWFYYRGIGRVTYDYQRDSGWHPHLFVADPMAFESIMPYRSQAAALHMPDDATLAMIQLMSGNASSIKASAIETYRLTKVPREYLDTAAELLLQNYARIANTGAIDAYAWLCNVLAHHGGARYQKVLATLKRQSIDAKLKKFAGRTIRRRGGDSDTPYVPGSISLSAQADKYPTLYPQITLIRGLL